LGWPCDGLAFGDDGGAKGPDSVGWRHEATRSGAAKCGPLVSAGHMVGVRLEVSHYCSLDLARRSLWWVVGGR
jgi:hypothetical protein